MRRAARQGAAGGQRVSDGELDGIGQHYPGWHPWRSSEGRFWAVRQGVAGALPGCPLARTPGGGGSGQ
jgi:hypothetical protein